MDEFDKKSLINFQATEQKIPEQKNPEQKIL